MWSQENLIIFLTEIVYYIGLFPFYSIASIKLENGLKSQKVQATWLWSDYLGRKQISNMTTAFTAIVKLNFHHLSFSSNDSTIVVQMKCHSDRKLKNAF